MEPAESTQPSGMGQGVGTYPTPGLGSDSMPQQFCIFNMAAFHNIREPPLGFP